MRKYISAAGAILATVTAPAAFAQKIGFDDLPDKSIVYSGSFTTGGYFGFTWINSYVISAASAQELYPTSGGFANSVVSPDNVMINLAGDIGGMAKQDGVGFRLFSIQLTSAYYDDEIAEFYGSTVDGRLLRKDVEITTSGPTLVEFDWSDLAQLSWYGHSPSGMRTGPGYSTLIFDDISIDPVPEPATWAMMILGMGAVGFAMRRRHKVTTRVTLTA